MAGIAVKSAPVEKLRPVPVSTTARISGSPEMRARVSRKASIISRVKAFPRSGRSNTTVATC